MSYQMRAEERFPALASRNLILIHPITTTSATQTSRIFFTSGCAVHWISFWPDLFRRLTTPKDEELVATPYRHGGKLKQKHSS